MDKEMENIELDTDMNIEMDNVWIKEYENEIKMYEKLYKQDVYDCNFFFITNEKIKRIRYHFNIKNQIKKRQIELLIKKYGGKDFIENPIEIVQYNNIMNPHDIIKKKDSECIIKTFSGIDEIPEQGLLFEPTIKCFTNMNSIQIYNKKTGNIKTRKFLHEKMKLQKTKKNCIH
jgi:hypothetical protein